MASQNCKICGAKLTETNTYATFRGRDSRCKPCHIQYMRDLRRKERDKKEQTAKEEPGFFSFDEDLV